MIQVKSFEMTANYRRRVLVGSEAAICGLQILNSDSLSLTRYDCKLHRTKLAAEPDVITSYVSWVLETPRPSTASRPVAYGTWICFGLTMIDGGIKATRPTPGLVRKAASLPLGTATNVPPTLAQHYRIFTDLSIIPRFSTVS